MKYTNKNLPSNHNKTQKKKEKLNGSILSKKEGWIVLFIHGEPFVRGYAHGALLYKELQRVVDTFPFLLKNELKVDFKTYMNACSTQISPIVMNDYPEFYEELRGISEGAKSKGLDIGVEYLIAWNSMLSMYSFFRNNNAYKCSAFIATGNSTEDKKIVMGHNTHADYLTGQIQNIVLHIKPSKGHYFVMQTCPGYIASGIDWFICSTGIIGCETTISGIIYKPEFGAPYFLRIRQAMQYGKSIDDYVEIMLKDNAGDYACSWLLGDINTNEIALFELGLKKHSIERTKNGVYYGMNTAIDFELRSTETNDKDLFNVEKSSGARNFRFNQLLNETYYGKINTSNAKKILSDHYDVFLHKDEMNSRSICKHSEYDEGKFTGKPYYPFGCTDAKVVDSKLAKQLHFIGRFGNCCGKTFNIKKHVKKHPEYQDWLDYMEIYPKRKWIIL